ncbi:MAG: hypothetical protein ACRDOO_15010 [Actinomadura sp.]
MKDGGIEWATSWENWLIILIFSLLGGLFVIWAEGGLAAGSDWLRDGKMHVKTYELTEIKLGESRSPNLLVLRDIDGHEFSIGLMLLQSNPDLWDLVYNGMLHSVHHGGAIINDRARERLLLDPRLHLVYDDDVEGS